MPDWWHELSFDLLCILNSIAAAAALVGVHSLRRQIHDLLTRGNRGTPA